MAPSSAWQSHPCCQAKCVCHTAGPEEPHPLQQCLCRAHASPCSFLLESKCSTTLPAVPQGTRASQHHATLGRKRPHTVRITFSPPLPQAAASHWSWAWPGLPLTGALGLQSSGFLAKAAESGPQPCSKGLTLPAVALLQLQAAKPRPGPPRAVLPLPVPLCSHLPSLH